jgi:hypothetical protein
MNRPGFGRKKIEIIPPMSATKIIFVKFHNNFAKFNLKKS